MSILLKTSILHVATFLLWSVLLLCAPQRCTGQFDSWNDNNNGDGNPKMPGGGSSFGNVNMESISADDMKKHMLVAAKLQAATDTLASEDAVDLAVFLDKVANDPSTKKMVENMRKSDETATRLNDIIDKMTQKEIVEALKQLTDDFKAKKELFQDPVKAVDQMHKDGLITDDQLDFYQKNPKTLEEDTRNWILFSFVLFAAAAGFL
jgi:hypothetical protein